MGDAVPNSTTIWTDAGSLKYGLSWSRGSSAAHAFYVLTHTRTVELRAAAMGSASRTAFESSLTTAEEVWWVAQPTGARDGMWAALRAIPL